MVGYVVLTGDDSGEEADDDAPAATAPSIDTGIDTSAGGDGDRFRPARYLVRPGDTLISVAELHALEPQQVFDELGLEISDTIDPGETLEMPTADAADPPRELTADPERISLVPVLTDAAEAADIPAELLMAFTWHQSGWDASFEEEDRFGLGGLRLSTVEYLNDEVLGGATLDPAVPRAERAAERMAARRRARDDRRRPRRHPRGADLGPAQPQHQQLGPLGGQLRHRRHGARAPVRRRPAATPATDHHHDDDHDHRRRQPDDDRPRLTVPGRSR